MNKSQFGEVTLQGRWLIKAPLNDVFEIVTDFEKFPEYFPLVAESISLINQENGVREFEATVKSFGKRFKVNMKTRVLPGKGFISDNDSYQFGTSGHEELLLSKSNEGTIINYSYKVTIHKKWLSIIAVPLLRWYSMKHWERAVINQLKKMFE